ncbi:MAG TPA: NTP transferase domain-containing protein [Mycobacteriales bacterium]|nr:NTP transferase domain-containing protein [Mycobacteriales bacterium]
MNTAAIVLAGGSARRFATGDKTRAELGGIALLDRVLSAVPAGCRVVVVGPPRPTARPVRFVLEEPAGGGPVAALAAGLRTVTAPDCFLLAADLPFVTEACLHALSIGCHRGQGDDGAVALDDQGREQWLLSYWHADALRAVLPSHPDGIGLHSVLGALKVARLAVVGTPPPWWDCDTPQAWDRAKEWL